MKLTLLLFLSVFTSLAQNIKGRILDAKTSAPISNVNIFIESHENGTVSNEKGEFNFKLNSKMKSKETIRFSKIGFNTITYNYAELKQIDFTIRLAKKTERLDEVTVTTKKKN